MGKIAFVFAGQGAQSPGMGKELYEISPAAKAVFDMAEKIRPGTINQCFEGTAAELALTINTQPCLFCVDLAAAAALAEKGIHPAMVAGFSVGEIPALAFAGKLSYEDAFRLVCARAEYMHEAGEKHGGAMFAVIGLEAGAIEEICKGLENAFAVNYNSPLQTVVACAKDVQDALAQKVKQAGGKALRLNVSGAFHSPFMNEAAQKLGAFIEPLQFSAGAMDVYSNVTAMPYTDKELIRQQVNSPVRWQKTIENMAEAGVECFVEVGPGKTLSGLIKKIDSRAVALNVENKASLENALEVLLNVNG